MPHNERTIAIDKYSEPGGIFLLTTQVGRLGIKLAAADIIVLYNSNW